MTMHLSFMKKMLTEHKAGLGLSACVQARARACVCERERRDAKLVCWLADADMASSFESQCHNSSSSSPPSMSSSSSSSPDPSSSARQIRTKVSNDQMTCEETQLSQAALACSQHVEAWMGSCTCTISSMSEHAHFQLRSTSTCTSN